MDQNFIWYIINFLTKVQVVDESSEEEPSPFIKAAASIVDILKDWLKSLNTDENVAQYISFGIMIVVILVLGIIIDLLARRVVERVIKTIIKKSKSKLDDIFLKEGVFHRLGNIIPILFVSYAASALFANYETVSDIINKLSNATIAILVMMMVNALLDAVEQVLERNPNMKDKPLDSYFQLARILVSIIGVFIALSIILDKNPIDFLVGLGGFTAIIILVFRDTILGFVASIYLSANDILRVGDWVEVPKYGADGDVTQITLTTVKIQNFDKTISTIPTYAFISDSFKNWRGMKESGGRRMKRNIYLKISSIRFCNEEMLDRFEKFQLITDYIKETREEYRIYNEAEYVDNTEIINGRTLTNIGVFQKYIEAYLRKHPNLHQENLTLMVRQLQPTELGLPLQVYAFTKTTAWIEYEEIQAEIFDHILASAPFFGIEIFQNPSGTDFAQLGSYAQKV